MARPADFGSRDVLHGLERCGVGTTKHCLHAWWWEAASVLASRKDLIHLPAVRSINITEQCNRISTIQHMHFEAINPTKAVTILHSAPRALLASQSIYLGDHKTKLRVVTRLQPSLYHERAIADCVKTTGVINP